LIATQARHGWISLRALPFVEPANDGGPADRDWRAATDLRVQPAGYGDLSEWAKIARAIMRQCLVRQQVTSWLADTDLIIDVERDLTTYGEEVKLAAAKSFAMEWASPDHARAGRR
jgi:hypothetical protein